jgi:enoyl-CoA hydratase
MTMKITAAPLEPSAERAGIRTERRGAAGVLTLTRPEKRNALNAPMLQALSASYPAFARDPVVYAVVLRSACAGVFSAGLDLNEIAALCEADGQAVRVAVGDAIRLCWVHESFTKPTVALVDGVLLGSGFGIGLHGTHRVAGEGYAFSCPEIALGLVPAGGACHALARLPGALGVYLALTGRPLHRADAFRCGLATHCVPAASFQAVAERLGDADPVDEVLDGLHADPGSGDLAVLAPAIARCFSAPSIEEVLSRLDAECGADASWARETADCLRGQPPLALAATRRLLAEAEVLDLRTSLMLEHRVLTGLMATPEAALRVSGALGGRGPGSGRTSSWRGDATAAMVSALFSDAAGPLLDLPTRKSLQAWGGELPADRRVTR